MKLKLNLLKKLFSVTLTTIFLIGFNVIPANAFNLADGSYDCNTGLLDNDLTTNYFTIESDSVIDGSRCIDNVVIPEGVTSIDNEAFSEVGITSVTFPNTLESIGVSAFYYNNLTSVIIPNSVTFIGDSAFSMNSFLTSVTFGNSVEVIDDYAFTYSRLNSVVLPDSVTTLGDGVFEDVQTITSVTIGNGLTYIPEYTFYGTGITSVTIPDSVTTINDSSFQNAYALTSVTIGKNVTFIGSAFRSNPLLGSITFLGNAPETEGAFYRLKPGAKAYVAYNATGFPENGSIWNGLIVVYGNAPSGSSSNTVSTPAVVKTPDAEINIKNGQNLSKYAMKNTLGKSQSFKRNPADKYKYSIFGTSKKTCAIKGNFVVSLKDPGACEMWVTRTTAKGKNYKYWVKINYIQ
jgi:hypothetical protein